MARNKYILKYGCGWPPGITDVEIEIECIRRGGEWTHRNKTCGRGLYHHLKYLQKALWPKKDWHRWNEMLVKQFIKHRIVGIIGAASSGKSHEAALYGLCMYYCFPNDTTVLVSSTEREMLELRIWGEIKKYHKMAKERFPFLPGELVESRQRIVSDVQSDAEYEDDTIQGRDFRNGVCGIPCKKGGNFIGLGSIVGVKNTRVIMVADELQFMPKAFIDAISNMNKNVGFQCIGMGNPKDPTDPLGMLCEPASELGGWEGGIDQTGATKMWKTRYMDGCCVQLVGSDSPNFDVPPELPPPYPYLIKRNDIESDRAFYGADSLQFTMMDEGRMPKGESSRRVITRMMCEKFGASGPVAWSGEKRTKIGFLDAAYGNIGGDRCVFGELQFGKGIVEGQERLIMTLIDTMIVPVSVKEKELPEDQIANFVKRKCYERDIDPHNFFFDSTGRGTLVSAFARLWSPSVVPVEFGGRPSDRIVSSERRIKASDYYSKKVTELWFNVRLIIEAGQFRGMTEDVMFEGCMREWKLVSGNKIEVEPKDKTKARMGRSPDLFDSLVAGVEGALQRGFRIGRLSPIEMFSKDDILYNMARRYSKISQNRQLAYR